MWNTAAEFTERKTRPRRMPDFVSRNKRTGKVSSEYWYTKDGVIRGSDHWGPGISSCDWSLDTVKFKVRGKEKAADEIAVTNKRYGVAKWSDFTQKTRDVRVDGKIIGQTNFENTTGKETVKIGEKHYTYDRNGEWFERWWEDTKKSIDYIVEVDKYNPYHDARGRFTTAGGASGASFRAGSRAQAAGINRIQRRRSDGGKPLRTKPAAGKMAQGKDISATFKYDAAKGKAIDQVAEKQGFKGKGRVVKDPQEFKKAVEKSGIVMYRTIMDGDDVRTGKPTKAQKFVDDLKNGDFEYNGSGARFKGSGIYMAGSEIVPGKMPSATSQQLAAIDSAGYAPEGQAKTVPATLDPSAKLARFSDVYNEFLQMETQERRARFNDDIGTYTAARGYDALYEDRGPYNHLVVYNRTKMIFFDTTYDNVAPTSSRAGEQGINPIPVI